MWKALSYSDFVLSIHFSLPFLHLIIDDSDDAQEESEEGESDSGEEEEEEDGEEEEDEIGRSTFDLRSVTDCISSCLIWQRLWYLFNIVYSKPQVLFLCCIDLKLSLFYYGCFCVKINSSGHLNLTWPFFKLSSVPM